MNGALYISFFQGQLESALEQVAQLAVQEITKTVGATLNSMLLETATKEQENQRLKSSLLARERERGDAARTPKARAPSRSVQSGGRSETLRREQKARAVGQLKAVMERVLEFAVCELSRIVEDSFDDLLSEFGKKEQENQRLKDQLRDENSAPEEAEEERERAEDSPSGSRVEKTEPEDEKEAMDTSGGSETPTVISVAQDWVPILDKVFGQKWCSDLWQIKEEQGSGPLSGGGPVTDMDSLIRETLMPSCVASQLELEVGQLDTEVLPLSSDKQAVPVVSSSGEESQIRSPSMLQRLLTLPSQLLEDDEEEESMEATPGPDAAEPQEPKSPSAERNQKTPRDEEEEEEEEELDSCETSRPRTRRKSHACGDCGRKFSRAHLLRAHRQTHEEMPSRCPECGKSFSQSSRLQAHLRTHSGKTI